MTSPPAALVGVQQPRLSSFPPAVTSAGQEAVDLAAHAGLILDPWQQLVLDRSLSERADGQWSAFEVALVVPRQNGKGSILEARTLAGIFLFGEELILHSAHEVKTAVDGFRRILTLIEDTPDLWAKVKRVSHSRGDEGIEFKSGQRLRFVARTKGSGRGFSADLVILDEAYDLPDAAMAAMMPTLSARSLVGNPQIWYTSSAVNAEEHPHGRTLARLRERGLEGTDPSLAFFEWSVDEDEYEADPDGVAVSEAAWAQANPGLGIRISPEAVAREQRSLVPKLFAVERLSVGDWPADSAALTVVPMDKWSALIDPESTIVGTPTFAIDIPPDRSSGSVSAAGRRADGKAHVETAHRERGTGWIVAWAKSAHESQGGEFVIDPSSPAGSLIPALEAEGVPLHLMRTRDVIQAFGAFYDDCMNDALHHLGQPSLTEALLGARKRDLTGGGSSWARQDYSVDISPLVAATNALWGAAQAPPEYDPLESAY